MPTLTEIPLRFACDVQSRTAAIPIGSSSEVIIYKGTPFVIQAAAFNGTPATGTYLSVSNVTQASLIVRKNNERGDVIIEKVLDDVDINTSVTYADWAAGNSQQFAFTLTDTDTNQPVPSDGNLNIYAAISIVVPSGEIMIGFFNGVIQEDGIGNATVPPDADYTSYSKAQVNALIGGQLAGVLSFSDILGKLSIDQLPDGTIGTLDSIDEDALYFFDNSEFLPKLISAGDTVAFISGVISFTDLSGTIALSQLPSGTAATVDTIDEDAFFFFNNSTGLPELLSIADTQTALGVTGGGGSIASTTYFLQGDGAGAAVASNLGDDGAGDATYIFNQNNQNNFAVQNETDNTFAGCAFQLIVGPALDTLFTMGAYAPTHDANALLLGGDGWFYNTGRIVIGATGAIVFANDGITTERARINNGLSVGSTTDPGAGNILLNGLTASAFVKTDGSKILVSKTASEMRTDLSLVIGTNVQAYDADLDAWAAKTTYAGSLTITTAKTFNVTNTLTLSGTDSSTLNVGAGGTLGSAAYTASSAYDVTGAAAAAQAASQPLDSDLTTIAGLTATTDNFIVSVSSAWASRTPSQVRTTLGLVIGTNVQAWDADLDTLAGLTATTDNFIVSVSSAWASRTPTQVKTTLGLTIGTNVQAWDADLDALAALSGTNNIYYRSASNTWSSVTVGTGLDFTSGTLSSTGGGAGGNSTNFSFVSSAVPNTSATYIDVTGLSFAVAANTKYAFKIYLRTVNAATSSGSQYKFTGPSSPTFFAALVQGSTSSVGSIAASLLSAFGSNTSQFNTSGSGEGVVVITGTLINGANAGTVQLQFNNSSATSTITVDAGSWQEVSITSGATSVGADSIWDAKGDLAVATGADAAAVLTVGANDTFLIADSAQTTGLKWGTPATARTALSLVIGTNVQAWDADLDTLAGLTATTDNFIVSVSSAWASRTPAQVLSTLAAVGTTFQPLDSDLTTIAGLTATTDNFILSVSSAWASRTPAQVLSTLAAVGTTFQPLDADLTTIAGLTATTDNFIVSVSSAWASRTPSQVRTTLGLVIGTNVQAWDADLDTLAGLTATTDNFIVSVSSAWASRTPSQVRTTLGLVIGTNVQAWDADLDSWAAITRASGFDTFSTTATSANLRSLLSDELGTGAALFDGPTLTLLLTTATCGSSLASINIPAGTVPTTPNDGDIFADANCFYGCTDAGNPGVIPIRHLIRADGTVTYANDTNAHAIFTTPTNGRITLETGTYFFEGLLAFTSMSASSGNLSIDMLGAGGASIGSWLWRSVGQDGASNAAGAVSGMWAITNTSSAAIVTAGTATAMAFLLSGTFEVTGAGTLVPSLTQANASASVLSIGSYLRFERIGSTSVTSVGQWD